MFDELGGGCTDRLCKVPGERFLRPALQVTGSLPVEETEERQGGRPEEREKQQGEPKARRAPEITQPHGGHTPSCARCGSAWATRLRRASGGACQCARRSRSCVRRSDNPRPLQTASSASRPGSAAA